MLRFTTLMIYAALNIFFSSEKIQAGTLEESQAMIQKMGIQAVDILTSSQTSEKERKQEAQKILDTYFDLQSIARFTMGHHWNRMTLPQKDQFITLFQQLLIKIYASRFQGYEGSRIVILGARQGSATITVTSEIHSPQRQPLKVDWKIIARPQGLRILDVVIGDVSMAITQRSEFSSLLQQEGGKIENFLNTLQERTQ